MYICMRDLNQSEITFSSGSAMMRERMRMNMDYGDDMETNMGGMMGYNSSMGRDSQDENLAHSYTQSFMKMCYGNKFSS